VPKTRLTDISVKALTPPQKGQLTYWDDGSPLGVRVSQGGAKSFVVLLGSGQRHTIGRYPTIKLADARDEAKRVLAEHTLGRHRPPSIRFAEALDLFVETHCKQHNKPSTATETERLLRKHFLPRLRQLDLAEISKRDVSQILDKLLPTQKANGQFAAIRAFFRWAVRRGLILHSPCEGMQLPSKPHARDRVLDDTELVSVWRAAEQYGHPFGTIVHLLILTGQRRGEIAALEWDWIGAETITLPAAITKNGLQHTFPIGNLARGVIESVPRLHEKLLFPARGKDGPFSGWSKTKAALDTHIATDEVGEVPVDEDTGQPLLALSPWTLHDLRRTFATNLAALGTPIHVTEKILNHVSGTVSGVAAVYNRHAYMDEMRAAIDAWESKLTRLLEP
jgi:integrase